MQRLDFDTNKHHFTEGLQTQGEGKDKANDAEMYR